MICGSAPGRRGGEGSRRSREKGEGKGCQRREGPDALEHIQAQKHEEPSNHVVSAIEIGDVQTDRVEHPESESNDRAPELSLQQGQQQEGRGQIEGQVRKLEQEEGEMYAGRLGDL